MRLLDQIIANCEKTEKEMSLINDNVLDAFESMGITRDFIRNKIATQGTGYTEAQIKDIESKGITLDNKHVNVKVRR